MNNFVAGDELIFEPCGPYRDISANFQKLIQKKYLSGNNITRNHLNIVKNCFVGTFYKGCMWPIIWAVRGTTTIIEVCNNKCNIVFKTV